MLILLILILLAANLLVGSVDIPPSAVWQILIGEDVANSAWSFIVWQSRVPQAVTALLCGMALSTAGLLLQTTFQNPLADPSILGISSGASLGVAIVMLTGLSGFTTAGLNIGGFACVVGAAFVGALAVMALILLFATWVRNAVMLLIIGIMIGYVASSAISLLNFFSTAEGVQSYVLWGMGSFSGVSLQQLPWFAAAILLSLALCLCLVKPLNALLLGVRYAENLGVNIRRTRHLLLLTTGLLTALTTAFCGPVSFIGLAVPHITRLVWGTSHHNVLLPLTLLTGGAVALLCNLLSQLPGEWGVIPLNAVTPLVGAPVIIYVIVNQRRIQYFN